jgi:hypothetical protein
MNAIAGTKINPQLLDASANGLAVSEVSQPDPVEPRPY